MLSTTCCITTLLETGWLSPYDFLRLYLQASMPKLDVATDMANDQGVYGFIWHGWNTTAQPAFEEGH